VKTFGRVPQDDVEYAGMSSRQGHCHAHIMQIANCAGHVHI